MSQAIETNQRLYEAVLAHPDDDGPRLEYADWFAQTGSLDRARLIRLQCQAAGLPSGDMVRNRLDSDARQLEYRHGKDWLEARPAGEGVRWEFVRGFPERVVFASFKALEAVEAEVFRHFVRRVSFNNLRSIARVAECASLARVHELDLGRCNLREEGIRTLVNSPHIRRLTWLDLSDNPMGPGGARLLADWAPLAEVRYLGLARAGIQDGGMAALARSGWLNELTELDLLSNEIGPDGFRAVAEAGCWPRLRVLALQNNRLGDEGARQLARAKQWTALVDLGLARNRIADEGMIALAGAEQFGNLEKLQLWSNGIGDAGIIALAKAEHLTRLRVLGLSGNMIGEEGAWALGRSPSLVALREVNLDGNAARRVLQEAVARRYRDQEPARLDAVGKLPAPTVAAELTPLPPLLQGEGHVDEDGLLQGILDNPDDEVARLIYADWLADQDQPERAEMIRLQCNPRPETQPREANLTKAIFARCPEAMQKQVERCYFKRGLLQASVTMRVFLSKAFSEQAPEWIRAARVHGLTLRGTTKNWQKAADSRVLSQVHELALIHNGLGDAGLGVLLGSPHLAGVHTLRIQKNGIRNGLTHLALATTLPRLRRLELPDNHLNLESLHALAGWPQASRLTSLDLQTNWLSAAEVSVLFNSPYLSGLTMLNLYYCRIGDSGARALASSPHMAGLRRLFLGNCGIGAEGTRCLAESPHLRRLKWLSLAGNPLGDEGVSALIDAPGLGEIRTITLSSQGLSEECIARLRQHPGERLQLIW